MLRVSVGGQVFCTLRTTLEQGSSFFAALLSDKFGPPVRDVAAGALFVDRSPELFLVVLEYLRRRAVFALPAGVALERLVDEAQFYGVEGLENELKQRQQAAAQGGAEAEVTFFGAQEGVYKCEAGAEAAPFSAIVFTAENKCVVARSSANDLAAFVLAETWKQEGLLDFAEFVRDHIARGTYRIQAGKQSQEI